MTRFPKHTTVGILALGLLSACAQPGGYYGGGPTMNKENVGTVLGGVGGAVIGSQFGGGSGQLAATAAGTLLGAFLGNQVGQSLDRADMQYADQSATRAFRTNNVSTWNNPNSGNSGTITPTRTYQSNGSLCREYQQTVTIEGRTQRAYGNACKQADGTWQIVN